MRKIDPEGIWTDFASQLHEQHDHFQSAWNALTDGTNRTIAAENYALTIGVMFEGYINDLIFAYANRDCSRLMRHLEDGVRATLGENPKALAAFEKFADFKDRKHLTKEELKEILDPDGRNTSFPNFDAVLARVQQWLADDHRNKFDGLNNQQRAVINATIAIRNNLAHRSKGSLDRMNEALDAGALHGTGLRRNVNSVRRAGYYLKARTAGGETRATALGFLLRDASEALVH